MSRETANPARWNLVSVAAPVIFLLLLFLLVLLLALPVPAELASGELGWSDLFKGLQVWVGTLLGVSLFGVVSSIIAFRRSEKLWGLSLLGLTYERCVTVLGQPVFLPASVVVDYV
jgi:hypothetical protein